MTIARRRLEAVEHRPELLGIETGRDPGVVAEIGEADRQGHDVRARRARARVPPSDGFHVVAVQRVERGGQPRRQLCHQTSGTSGRRRRGARRRRAAPPSTCARARSRPRRPARPRYRACVRVAASVPRRRSRARRGTVAASRRPLRRTAVRADAARGIRPPATRRAAKRTSTPARAAASRSVTRSPAGRSARNAAMLTSGLLLVSLHELRDRRPHLVGEELQQRKMGLGRGGRRGRTARRR